MLVKWHLIFSVYLMINRTSVGIRERPCRSHLSLYAALAPLALSLLSRPQDPHYCTRVIGSYELLVSLTKPDIVLGTDHNPLHFVEGDFVAGAVVEFCN